MASPTQSWRPQKPTIILLFFLCISLSSSLEEAITPSNKLDQPVLVADQPEDPEIKCGSCPCGDTCGGPPPPPPSPSPPPPPLPCPSPPPPPPPSPPPPSPPPPKYPSCPENCNPSSPPPPPPRIIYVPGQPKPSWIYYYSAAEKRGVGILLVLALGGLSVAMVLG